MQKGISQEGLKLIACLTMLIDHIGSLILWPLWMSSGSAGLYELYLLCRCVGRIALPIFAFLLVEGAHRTRSRKKYAIRLALGAVLAELPYNLATSGRLFAPEHQSIMLTLLLGYGAVLAMEKCKNTAWKPVAILPFALAAELVLADYGWAGVLTVALFDLSRDYWRRTLVRSCGMVVLAHLRPGMALQLGGITLPVQALSALSMIFISAYDGRKLTHSRAVQWGFYLFYPLHLLVLWALGSLLTRGILL